MDKNSESSLKGGRLSLASSEEAMKKFQAFKDECLTEKKAIPPKAVREKIGRKMRFKKNASTVAWLIEHYPDCFSSTNIIPLKLSIHKDLLGKVKDDSISNNQLRRALSFYTRRPVYWSSVEKYDYRIDLDGNPVEKISPEHKKDAIERLSVHHSKYTGNRSNKSSSDKFKKRMDSLKYPLKKAV